MPKIKERMNLYLCEHGCHNVTVDVDKGVTPFMIPCNFTGRPDRPLNPLKAKDGRCVGVARSSMYPKEIDAKYPYPKPTHEWYRPELLEYSKLSDPEKDHVKNGGLLLRERTDRDPILHTEDMSWDNIKIPDYDSVTNP